jgi:hypothetical protein
MWKLDYDDKHIDVIWTGDNHPKCRFCDEPLVGWMIKKMRIKQTGDYHGHAMDIETICPDCRGLEIFGIAITPEQFKDIKCMEVAG